MAKAAIIGAGSTYTPELVDGLVKGAERLSLDSITLMDIDPKRLEIVGGLSKRQLEAGGFRGKVELTTELDRTLDGVSYLFAQIRVGKMNARVLDEKIPLKYGLLGQETTGAGGFAKALRTVPVIMNIVERMKALSADDAWLINFSNPSGIIAEAVLNHTDANMLGLCNCAINMLNGVTEAVGTNDYEYEYIGLNHLSWITSVIKRGESENLVSQFARNTNTKMKNIPGIELKPELLSAIPYIPSYYLTYFYAHGEHVEKCMASEKTRGEVCLEVDEELFKQYADPNLCTKPPGLDQRGGALYSQAAVSAMESIALDKNETHVVVAKNNGAVPFMADDDTVEIKFDLGKNGAVPHPVHEYNEYIVGLMQAIKAYEKLTVKAALDGDRDAALAALMVHPLIGDGDKAIPMLNELLEANREFLPRFYS